MAFRRGAFEAVGGYPEWLDVGEDMYLDHRFRERGFRMGLARDAIAHWPMRKTASGVWRQYFRYARGDALAGMHAGRHAVRFSVYAGALGALAALPSRRLPAITAAFGAALYAKPRLRRAMHLLPGQVDRAKALLAVPVLLGFIDAAKMAGYASGLWERAYRARSMSS